ncbi:hypothetical protein I6N98_12910 [Spongiibacter nanhainus]|uniref:Glycosyl hydrolase n=1 Tax=Spongiibacter nanhainus TaxID=2794344 RepID=A0A7T4QYT3_9GAMM|nr:hypothetical protein [Spongiibacter nanhainus]QQD17261.1 hypothetical protein I6N98_12910 [Spongiibacter nanhainus]
MSVDFSLEQGKLRRSEQYNTWDNGDPAPELREKDVEFLNEQGLHSRVVRVGITIDELCDLKTHSCDFNTIAPWLDDISRATDSMVVHVTPKHLIEEKRPPKELEPLLYLAIRELKKRFPKIDYIEATNEPDWEFHGAQIYAGKSPILSPAEVYPYYVPYYKAVNRVNAELADNQKLRVGGPALTGMTEFWMTAFLDGYAADSNPQKQLDFVSYHGYGEFSDDFSSYRSYKSDPSEIRDQRQRLDRWLVERQLTPGIPVLVTETGIYPGPSFDDPDPSKKDYLRQAAGQASLFYWWGKQAEIYPFHWVVRHATQGRKDQLITHSAAQPEVDTFSPYGNLLLMQSMMKQTRVKARSNSLSQGLGVYAIAAKDTTGVSVMVWNYQHTNAGRFRTQIQLSSLPAELRDQTVRQRLYRIDQTTSNYWHNPDKANLQQVAEKTLALDDSHTETVELEANGLYLMVLEPVSETD